MTREETIAWAKSLKPGEKVIFAEGWGTNNLSVLEVKKVTPSGWIKTTNGLTFAMDSWSSSLKIRGGRASGYIQPVTDELLQEAQRQDAERQEKELQWRVIVKARNFVYDEYRKGSDMTYDRAAKIVDFFNQLDSKDTTDA